MGSQGLLGEWALREWENGGKKALILAHSPILKSPVHTLEVVIRRFPRDRHIMRVRLAQTTRRDPYKPRIRAQRMNVRGSAVSHTASQSADELEDHVRCRPLVWHASLDAFGHELTRAGFAFLEVSIG